jgi:hypothetical protein
MKDEDIVKLKEEEIEKIERVKNAETERLEAESHLESKKSWRVLFERAPEATLPFIIYVVYMGSVGLAILFQLINKTGEQLYIGAILLVILMIAPLFVLPSESWKRLFRYLRNKVRGSEQE